MGKGGVIIELHPTHETRDCLARKTNGRRGYTFMPAYTGGCCIVIGDNLAFGMDLDCGWALRGWALHCWALHCCIL
jgi:hypothetical protein